MSKPSSTVLAIWMASLCGISFVLGAMIQVADAQHPMESKLDEFSAKQERDRQKLWGLLGDLPRGHRPNSPKLIKKEHVAVEGGVGFTLEHLELDLNGLEPVPAILLVPDRRLPKAPGMLYLHWHGSDYALGKVELLKGNRGLLGSYAQLLASKGIVVLAIDSWCFGERNHGIANNQIEMDTFKDMLWHGRVLWGMMLWDEYQALTYLCARPEVDADCIGVMGMSMGATKAWWLAALDPRIVLCIDICCLTDYDELLQNHNLQGHGIYYYVPSLLKHFTTAQINELIVPRARLSLNGRLDGLTPPAGIEKVRKHLLPLYHAYNRLDDCRIEVFEAGHQETPEMRILIKQWLDDKLLK